MSMFRIYGDFDIEKFRQANPHLTCTVQAGEYGQPTYLVTRAKKLGRRVVWVDCPGCDARAASTLARKFWFRIPHKDQWVCPACHRTK